MPTFAPSPLKTRRDRQFFAYTADLFAPQDTQTGPKANDSYYGLTPTLPAQPTYYCPTPEVDVPDEFGLSKQVNIFVLDKWYFLATCPIADNWAIRMATPGHPLNGVWWYIEGNSQVAFSPPNAGRRVADFLMVYSRRGPAPHGFSKAIP